MEGNEAVDFAGAGRRSTCEFIGRTLGRFGYRRLARSDKALVRRYLAKVTGRSRGGFAPVPRYGHTGGGAQSAAAVRTSGGAARANPSNNPSSRAMRSRRLVTSARSPPMPERMSARIAATSRAMRRWRANPIPAIAPMMPTRGTASVRGLPDGNAGSVAQAPPSVPAPPGVRVPYAGQVLPAPASPFLAEPRALFAGY